MKKVRLFKLWYVRVVCEESLCEFVSDEMVDVFKIIFKSVNCNFTNLSLYLKIFN